MRVSYQHANPAAGNESFLLRFRGVDGSTPCLLVDAGNGVDLDALTEPDDRLVGICLTHAHLDHYATVAAAHREGVPILVSPATGAILGDVLDVAGTEYGVDSSRAVRDAITPVEERRELAAGVSVQPVSAGHAPGAVGWLVTATDGDDTHRLLATGDFTRRRVAGYPGLPADELPPVDVLFLTASTNDRFETALTEALGTALEHAGGGKRTLVAASGLTGVHAAYLLSAVVDRYGLRVPVRVVGQAAKLYERLGYDRPGVESIPRFDDPRSCLEHGAVTVAGPEIPRERSSGRMFGLLREDPNGSVLQLVGSGVEPLTDARCTLHDYEIVNHPTRETLTTVHDAVDPTETVIVHAHRGADRAFNGLDSVVWGTGDRAEYTLYDGTGWRLPPWMDGGYVSGGGRVGAAAADTAGSVPVPTTARQTEPDLAAEGVDTDRLADLLHHRQGAATDTATPSTDTGGATPRVATDGASATDDTAKTMSENEDTAEEAPDHGPIRTTGAAPDDDPDPAVERMLEEQNMSPEEFTAAVESVRAETAASEPPTGSDTGEPSDGGAADGDESGGGARDTTDGETHTESRSTDADHTPTQTDATGGSEVVSTDDGVTANGRRASPGGDTPAGTGTAVETEHDDPPTATTDGAATRQSASTDEGITRLRARWQWRWHPEPSTGRSHTTRLRPLSNGTSSQCWPGTPTLRTPRRCPSVSTHTQWWRRRWRTPAAATDRFADAEALMRAATAAALGVDEEAERDGHESRLSVPAPRPVPALARHADRLDAVVANDDHSFETETAVVDAAVAWALDPDPVAE
ncbi:MAG: putative exonuclease of the beta-lactamase fold involved in RNA processing [halophilic archaeon J07HB67]|nr:MAG: putative exonuclease of the beta-lactamase fold involved in RNA processing [halophilic archaeon J07HB67]